MLLINGGRSGAGLIYVSNLVEIMLVLASNPRAQGRIVNICDPEYKTWAEYVSALQDLLSPHRTRFLNVPGRVAHGVGHLMEIVFGAVMSSRRPLLTRHAASLLWRDQNYDIATLQSLIGQHPLTPYDLAQTGDWLDSPEGRSRVPRPDLTA